MNSIKPLQISLFSNRTAAPERLETTWPALCERLQTPLFARSKDEQPCWSPCIFRGNRRTNADAIELSCFVLDLDDTPLPAVQALQARLTALDLASLWHETWTTPSPGRARLRVVIPLAEPAPAKGWRDIRRAMLAHVGFSDADPACADAARLYYLPGYLPL